MRFKSGVSMVSVTAGLMAVCVPVEVHGQLGGASPPAMVVLYGISREDGRLVRYDYSAGQSSTVGLVQQQSGGVLTGIDASAYIPAHANIYAFWTDPSDNQVKLIYINCRTALGEQVGEPLGAGRMTGATAFKAQDASWVFTDADGTQQAPGESDYSVCGIYLADEDTAASIPGSGDININPSNSDDNEFVVTLPDGSLISRDDLHAKDMQLQPGGVFYSGPADSIRVKPKGNANQNNLMYGEEILHLENGKTYRLSGQGMTIRVYNDHVNNKGKAMGHWWVHLEAAHLTVEGDGLDTPPPAPSKPSGLYQIDHHTGRTRLIMALEGAYDGLASLDGERFLATRGSEVYLLTPATQTESLLGGSFYGPFMGLEYASTRLMGFENTGNRLMPISDSTGAIFGLPSRISGFTQLGTIIYMEAADDPALHPELYD